MNKDRSSLSKAKSYREIGDFWDTHDLSEFWDMTKEAEFQVGIETETIYYALDKKLSEQIQAIARERGISADTLVNLWIQEKLQEQEV